SALCRFRDARLWPGFRTGVSSSRDVVPRNGLGCADGYFLDFRDTTDRSSRCRPGCVHLEKNGYQAACSFRPLTLLGGTLRLSAAARYPALNDCQSGTSPSPGLIQRMITVRPC